MDLNSAKQILDSFDLIKTASPDLAIKVSSRFHTAIKSFFEPDEIVLRADGKKSWEAKMEQTFQGRYGVGGKIEAIKYVRNLNPGMGLKEAKDWVESNMTE